MSYYVSDISRQHRQKHGGKELPDELYVLIRDEIHNFIRFSTRNALGEHEYYKKLDPHLKQTLVKWSLSKLIYKMRFFFKDFNTGFEIPVGFVHLVVTHLDAALYQPGETIIK